MDVKAQKALFAKTLKEPRMASISELPLLSPTALTASEAAVAKTSAKPSVLSTSPLDLLKNGEPDWDLLKNGEPDWDSFIQTIEDGIMGAPLHPAKPIPVELLAQVRSTLLVPETGLAHLPKCEALSSNPDLPKPSGLSSLRSVEQTPRSAPSCDETSPAFVCSATSLSGDLPKPPGSLLVYRETCISAKRYPLIEKCRRLRLPNHPATIIVRRVKLLVPVTCFHLPLPACLVEARLKLQPHRQARVQHCHPNTMLPANPTAHIIARHVRYRDPVISKLARSIGSCVFGGILSYLLCLLCKRK